LGVPVFVLPRTYFGGFLVLDAGSSVSVAIPGSASTRFINKTGTPSQNLLITHYSLRITHYFLW